MARLRRALGCAVRDRSYQLAAAGGLAGMLAFEPANLKFLIPLTPLACFLVMKMAPTPGAAFRRVWLLGWVLNFGALHWLCTLYRFNPLAPLGIILLGGYLGAYIGLVAYVARRWLWGGGDLARFTAFASLWLLEEWFRTLGRLAVPLVQLGHAWATWPWAIQIAQWLGELGVSLEILIVAGLIFFWARLGIDGWPAKPWLRVRVVGGLSLATLALLGWFVCGHALANRWDRRVASPVGDHKILSVALVQPNINQMAKLASYAHEDATIRANLSEQITVLNEQLLTQLTHPGWDLVVMPETAFTDFGFYQNTALRHRIGRLAQRIGADLFFGASRDMSTPVRSEVYNSAYFVHADGRFDEQVYDKMRLVPFGESMPYFDLIPGFQENIVGIGTFAEGERQPLFETHGLHFGALICFESTFSAMSRALTRSGADFLVVITNDAWYGLSAGAAHHHHLSLLRAVETRRWILRCANTGISSIIAPSGRIASSLALDERGVLDGSIAIEQNQKQTAFARWGNAWMASIAVILFALFISSRGEVRRR